MARSKSSLKWQSSTPIDPTKPSILTLLPELRHLIIEKLVVSKSPLKSVRPRYQFFPIWGRDYAGNGRVHYEQVGRLDVSLMRTCRQLHVEVAHLLYTRNMFLLADASPIRDVELRTLRPPIHAIYADYIRRVEIPAGTRMTNTGLEICEMLHKWRNVEVLVFRLSLVVLSKAEYMLGQGTNGYNDEAMRLGVKHVRGFCTMQDLKLPMKLKVILCLGDTATENETAQLKRLEVFANEVLERAKGQRRLKLG